MGHATRSVPIIESLLHFGGEVEITSSGGALSYLKKRFPSLRFHALPDREVLYSKKGAQAGLLKRAFVQSTINKDQNKFIRKIVVERKITHLVSDNVYGAYDQRIPSVLISHQLSLKLPFGESPINAKLAAWINRFSEVWIPDGSNHLVSGDLAANHKVSIRVQHLGIPSRFWPRGDTEKKFSIGVVLGGPEPQRSILEERILEILATVEGRKILFRGSEKSGPMQRDGIDIDGMGDGNEMAEKLSACELVIGRSGYSTLCDFLAIGAKALLIPTPGQTEQEYLAKRMKELPQFSCCAQDKLDANAIRAALSGLPSSAEIFELFTTESKVVRDFLGS